MLGVVVRIDGFDPVTNAPVTLRAGSHDDAAVCHLDGQTWWPALLKLPTLRYDLFDGAFGGQITAPSSTLKLSVEPWPDFGRYAMADARLRLWTGEVGQPWSAWTLRFDGLVSEQPTIEDGQADVAFAVDDRWLDSALLATYAGTTGAEGGAELKGVPKPLALGAPRYVPGVLVDVANSVFQVSGYGAIQGIEAALERLARFGAPITDYASHAALVAAQIPAGRWATCLAEGKARFGAPPTGQISFLVLGDQAGPNGWARRPGQLIRRLALLSGGAGRIHDASLNALDLARPYNCSIYIDQQTTARQLIQQLAASVNAVAALSWTGQLFAVPVAIGAAAVTLAADGSALPPVGKVKQIGIASPFKKLAIGAERAWTVHALADVAFTATLIDMGAYAAGTTYREGNLVQSAGSTWLYINPAPSSGNAPPALPIEENAFWRVLARAGARGADAPLVLVQWSIDGVTNWHPTYFGADIYYRQSNDGGLTWGPAIKGVGESGDVGADGTSPSTVYLRSEGAPARPFSDTGNPPAGWYDGPPAGSAYLWMSKATFRGTTQLTDWSDPQRISGDDGADAPGISLAPTALAARYDAADVLVPGQSVTWTATRVNTGAATVWGIYNAAGVLQAEGAAAIFPAGAPGTWASSDNDHLTLTSAGIASLMNAYGGSMSVRARIDGTDIADRKSLTKVKDGVGGADGDNALLFDSNVQGLTFLADYLGNLKQGQIAQTIVFSWTDGGGGPTELYTFAAPEASGCQIFSFSPDGLLIFNNVTASGYVRVTSTYKGLTRQKKVPITLVRDPAPANSDNQASARAVGGSGASSYPSNPAVSVIASIPSGLLRAQINVLYSPDDRGNTYLATMAAFRVAGSASAWQFFPETQGSQARISGTPAEPINELGAASSNQTVSLAPGRYEIGLFVRQYAGGQPGSFDGTLQGGDG
jgi:hypothetical protein